MSEDVYGRGGSVGPAGVPGGGSSATSRRIGNADSNNSVATRRRPMQRGQCSGAMKLARGARSDRWQSGQLR
jgi:hypothetical protein